MVLTAEQLAAVIAYVLPGFAFLKVSAAFASPRTTPAAEEALMSVILSIPLTFVARWVIGLFGGTANNESLPAVSILLGIVLGVVFGGFISTRWVRLLLGRMTTMSHTRIWMRPFAEHDYYILVTVENGDVFLGYAVFTPNDPTVPVPDIVLGAVERVDAEGNHIRIEGTDTMYIPASHIRLIQFLAKPPRSAPASSTRNTEP